MPTVIERIGSVDTGGLEQQLAAQVGALRQAIALAGPLLDGKTPDIGTLTGRLGGLRTPSFDGSSFRVALDQAVSLTPGDLTAVVGPLGSRFAEMTTLVEERLTPLLRDAVAAARAIQHLLNVRLGCLDGIRNARPSPAPGEPAPGDPPPPGRVAVAAQQVAQVDAVLSQLPDTVDAGVLLQLLLMLLGSKPRDRFFAINLPVVDDLLEPLQTLAAWATLDQDGVAAHMAASIDALTARIRQSAPLPLADLAATLDTLAPQWRAGALASATDAIADGMTALEDALRNADEAAAATLLTAVNAAIDDYEAIRAAMSADVLPAVPSLHAVPALSPAALADHMTHLLVLLEPTNVTARLAPLLPQVEPIAPEAMEAVRNAVQPLIDWLQDITGLLDFGAAQDGIADVAADARALAADIESGLTSVTLEVQAAFAAVSEALDGVGLDDLRAQLATQIAQFGDQVRRDVAQAFAPARDGTRTAITAVSNALDAFDPSSIVDALQKVVDEIAGVLNGDDVQRAIGNVKEAVDDVAEALRSLSFQPVTDEVVALIGQMKAGLQAIIDTDINDATKAALATAMSALPGDLRPATDPLVEDFGVLVATGPTAVLRRVKDAPQRLLDQVRRFEPAAMIGDRLSAPYRDLLARADDFDAARLFAAADAELERARQRLLRTVRPGRALEPLRAPVQQLLSTLETFSAAALLDPLTSKVEETVARIVEASPVDEILGAIDGVFDAVRDILAFAEQIRSVSTRIGQLFDALADADVQVDAWRDHVLANVPDGANGPLQTAFAALRAALDGVRHADVLASFDTASAAVLSELDALDPAARLTRIVTAYGRLASRVAALPPSATRTAAEQVLARFNPAQPLHSAPLRLAHEVRTRITSARSGLVALAHEWTEMVDGLEPLRHADATALRDLVAAALEPTLQPVRFIFRALGHLAVPVNGITSTLTDLVTTLTARLDALVNGPESLSAISGAVQEVVDALRHIDLGFIARSLDEVRGAVHDKVRLLDPARLAGDLDAAFEQALSGLSLGAIVPTEDLAALDAAWQGIVDKLHASDPRQLVEQAVQPVYDAAITPLLDAFDLTPIFEALIDVLGSLERELATGIDQVNIAYQSFIANRPAGGSVSVSLGA